MEKIIEKLEDLLGRVIDEIKESPGRSLFRLLLIIVIIKIFYWIIKK